MRWGPLAAATVIVIMVYAAYMAFQDDTDTPLPNEDDVSGEAADMRMDIGDRTFMIVLYNTEAASEFASMAPLELRMNELNGNEKYVYLDRELTTSQIRMGTIHAGDVMLFGDDCLVVFYETFSTPYSYTPIGKVTDVSGLAEALGSGDVTVSFS